jgi:hypothetical protein
MSAQWYYVIGAYAVTLGGLLGVALYSYRSMKAAEGRVEKKDRD